MTATTKVLLTGLTFAEGARWHDGRLWFSDMYTQRVLAMDPQGRAETMASVPQRPSGLGFLPDGTPLVVSMLDRRVLAIRTGGRTEMFADLSEVTGGPCNDMVVDARGRAYVGNFGYEKWKGAPQRLTRIVRVDPDASVHPTGTEILFPNGMVITPDGRTLIVAETFSHRMSMYDIDDAGDLRNPRVYAEIEGCNPDGLALDAEAAVWVADPAGKRCRRVFEGGRIEREIGFRDNYGAYTCALGGEDRRTLFIVTCTDSGPQMAERRDGCIEAIPVDVAGAGWP
jgi:sugar lactone lactonase YvrE